MNKAELIEALAVRFDGNKAEAGRMLNIVVETIMQETARHGKVGITGFGVFETVRRDERIVRNPRTGERKKAGATSVVRFRPGADLKAYAAGEKELPHAPPNPKQAPNARDRASAKHSEGSAGAD